jgi:DNA-binding transcriptional ArsR family regulator
MKRNMDTIRTLLLRLEALPMSPSDIVIIGGSDEELQIDGQEPDAVDYHLYLLRENGLIDSPGSQPLNGRITFRRLTWAGHDFLDSVRDDEIWRKTKLGAEQAGGWTFDLITDLAKGLIKTQIKKYTGVET